MRPTERFSDRVSDYVKFRPSYPTAVIQLLTRRCRLNSDSAVADVGSGTGIFSDLLLQAGAEVFGVEPNVAMRQEAELRFAENPRFHSIDGTAEASTLTPDSVDLVTCAQAFHWFDERSAPDEFRRILRQGGHLALIWNERPASGNEFLENYEALLDRFCPDYRRTSHREFDAARLAPVFHPAPMSIEAFENRQRLNREALVGRALSSSYSPGKDDPARSIFVAALNSLFDSTATDGLVSMDFETRVYFGQLT